MGVKGLVTAMLMGFLLVMLTLLIPVRIEEQAGLAEVRLGLPWPFVIQDQSHYAFVIPCWTHFYSPWECPTDFRPLPFTLDVALVSALFALVADFALRLKKNHSAGSRLS